MDQTTDLNINDVEILVQFQPTYGIIFAINWWNPCYWFIEKKTSKIFLIQRNLILEFWLPFYVFCMKWSSLKHETQQVQLNIDYFGRFSKQHRLLSWTQINILYSATCMFHLKQRFSIVRCTRLHCYFSWSNSIEPRTSLSAFAKTPVNWCS